MGGASRIEKWIAGLNPGDRVVTCTIVRGEILSELRDFHQAAAH
jgi:hypothetical protein